MKQLKLGGKHGKGIYALVDDENYKELSKSKWHLSKSKSSQYVRGSLRCYGHLVKVFLHHAVIGRKEGFEVDHINGDTLDNRRENLRFVTRRQNCMNRHRVYGSSRYKGVTWVKMRQKWGAFVTCKNKLYFAGHYENEVAAAKGYDRKAIELHGAKHVKTNFPLGGGE